MLFEMISTGETSEGQRLPTERELVDRLEVSRTVVREALNLLEARGVIKIEHGRGAVVGSDGGKALRDTLGYMLRVSPSSLGKLVEIRKILEVEIAGFAAERRSEEDLEAMRSSIEVMSRRLGEPAGRVDADVDFHAKLARATYNEVLLTMLEPITDLLRRSREVSTARPGSAKRALQEHEKILERVEASDAEGAREQMREHLLNTEGDLREALGGSLDVPLPEANDIA